MSAPNSLATEATYLSYGFLAAKASTFLARVLSRKQINDEAKESLLRAQKFLVEVASGAKLVKTGEQSEESGITALDSITVLGYAMDPIEQLQVVMKDEDIEKAFTRMANAISKV